MFFDLNYHPTICIFCERTGCFYTNLGNNLVKLYSYYSSAFNCHNCFDCWFVVSCDSCYACANSEKCYKVVFSQYANNCLESAFLFNCMGCSYCFGCMNLRNKSYYIFNKPYSKEEYLRRLVEYNFGYFTKLTTFHQLFQKFKVNIPHRFANVFNSSNVRGDHIRHTKNCDVCFDTYYEVENCRYVYLAGLHLTESYDVYDAGTNSSLLYEVGGSGINLFRSAFSNWVLESREVYYSDLCGGCSDLFGCIGLRNKQYCILNKQYSKSEYESLVPKIIEHMNQMPYVDKKGRVYKYGEFFPPELSPFAYNETIAQEYFPLTKEQALAQGYAWKDPEERNLRPDLRTEDLPDHIKDVKDDIVGKIIQCGHSQIKGDGTLEMGCNEQCTTAFKIIPEELQFYRRMNLPLPRLCPNCRHYQRLKQRNPLKLWHRKCMCAGRQSYEVKPRKIGYTNTVAHFHGDQPCANEFETFYAPDRKEIVYCEECYNAEVV